MNSRFKTFRLDEPNENDQAPMLSWIRSIVMALIDSEELLGLTSYLWKDEDFPIDAPLSQRRKRASETFFCLAALTSIPSFLFLYYRAPIAFVAGMTSAIVFLLIALRWRRLYKQWELYEESFAKPICPTCGYDVRGNTSRRCPECGEAIPKWTPRSETKAE